MPRGENSVSFHSSRGLILAYWHLKYLVEQNEIVVCVFGKNGQCLATLCGWTYPRPSSSTACYCCLGLQNPAPDHPRLPSLLPPLPLTKGYSFCKSWVSQSFLPGRLGSWIRTPPVSFPNILSSFTLFLFLFFPLTQQTITKPQLHSSQNSGSRDTV